MRFVWDSAVADNGAIAGASSDSRPFHTANLNKMRYLRSCIFKMVRCNTMVYRSVIQALVLVSFVAVVKYSIS